MKKHILLLAAFFAMACGEKNALLDQPQAPIFDNLGDFHFEVRTKSALAQRFFNQGMIFCYAFNYAEAIRSFREAARLDPGCPMFYWGQALAMGPHVNEPREAKTNSDAFFAIQRALQLIDNASAKEKAYIHALAKRHSLTYSSEQDKLDIAYAKAMHNLHKIHPDDPNAATLFAESIAVRSPWNYWSPDGKPYGDTPKMLEALASALKIDPQHPGALHFHIHAVEAKDPESALASAEKLVNLVPGAGHLVHMPAHIFLLTGHYAKATVANERAAAADEAYLEACREQGFLKAKSNLKTASVCGNQAYYAETYYPHNLHFLWYTACMAGRSEIAIDAANRFLAAVSEKSFLKYAGLEIFRPLRLLAYTRFGKWDKILKEPLPKNIFQYSTGISHYARGVAFARMGQLSQARQELLLLTESMNNETLEYKAMYGGGAVALTLLQIANELVQAAIARAEGKFGGQIAHLHSAVQLQDELPFTEPPAWHFPIRQALGAALLEGGKSREAEKVYKQDLEMYPENGWSLYGLHQSLLDSDSPDEANEIERRLSAAWAGVDIAISRSSF